MTQASDAPPGEGAEGRPPKVPETEILKSNTSALTAAQPLGKHLGLCSFQIKKNNNNHVLHIRPKNWASGRQNHHGGCRMGMGPTRAPSGCPAGRNVLASKIQITVYICACILRRVQLFGALQVPLSMGFSGQEYWSGLPFPTPGDLPYPGI